MRTIKILIYGAGIIGNIIAFKLKNAGKDVKILARGKKLENIRKNGIRIRDDIAHEDYQVDIDPVEELKPDDYYDIVLVIMQCQQVQTIFPILKKNSKIPMFVFIGNNVRGAKIYREYLDEDKILLGFGLTGGYWDKDIVISGYLDQVKLCIGELDGTESNRLKKIKSEFEEVDIEVEISENIDAWLKCHAGLISPLALSYYALEKDQRGEQGVLKTLDTTVEALRENIKALKDINIPILPKKFNTLSFIPKFLIKRKFQKMYTSDVGRIFLRGHANAAQTEMMTLAHDFREFVKDSKVNMYANNKLFELTEA